MFISGKQRAQKIDRQYHALPDRYVIRKRWLGLLGLLLSFVYSSWLFSSRGTLEISTGELSQAHYAWNKSGCEKCHVEFLPIRKDSFGGNAHEAIAKNNYNCNSTCHAVTGHFEAQSKANVLASQSCSDCHQEHLGFNRSLVDIADKDCSVCHGKLGSVASSKDKSFAKVVNFSEADGHPAFSFEKLSHDPGTIKFSHSQHLRPGQPKTPGDKTAKRLENLEEKYRQQYEATIDENQLIQLRCADCHQRDVEVPGYEFLESFESGQTAPVRSNSHLLYKPVEFEKHCIACHDLGGVQHGLDRKQTEKAIDNLLPLSQVEFFKNKSTSLDSLSLAEIEDRELRLKSMLGSKTEGCVKCHRMTQDQSSNSLVEPSNLKERWLKDATFTHGAHLMVSCKDCHGAAYIQSDNAINSEVEAQQIMIPGIENCRECHIQDAEKRGSQFATNNHVASADCIDCHRYHTDAPKSLPSQAASMEQLRLLLTSRPSP